MALLGVFLVWWAIPGIYGGLLDTHSADDEFHFKSWLSQHEKRYTVEEYYQRLPAFSANRRRVELHNAQNHSYRLGLNQFADLTFTEFKKLYLWSEPQNCSATRGNFLHHSAPFPDSVDWREKGDFVTAVKNQGPCGSCWTFSTTGCLESAVAIATGNLLSLSEQQLVDCAQAFNNHGCSGGLPSQAFEYILYNKGIMSEETYPYTAANGTCHFQPKKVSAMVKEVINITMNDELGMVKAVAYSNPVSFAFDVTSNFMLYKDGVYTEYFNIERGRNMCGLATCASYPIPQV